MGQRGRILLFTLIAIASLFSLRNKEIVLTVPDLQKMKPRTAEAVQSSQLQDNLGVSPSNIMTRESSIKTSPSPPLSSGKADSYQPVYEAPTSSPPPSTTYTPTAAKTTQETTSLPGTPASAETASGQSQATPNVVYYGLGGVVVQSSTQSGDTGDTGGTTGGGVTASNNAPSIISFEPSNTTPTVDEGGSINFSVTATDPDGNTLSYTWQLDTVDQSSTTNQWMYNPNFNSAGSHTVTVTVSDGSLTDAQTWNVTVNDVSQGYTSITEITPDYAARGAEVVIQGCGFSSTIAENIVKFDTLQAEVLSVTAQKQIRVRVPNGLPAGFADVSVSVNGDTSNLFTFGVLKDSSSQIFADETASRLADGVNIVDSSIVKSLDIDADKDMDIIVVDILNGEIHILVNDSSGHFADESSQRLQGVTGVSAVTDIAFADVNDDGFEDLFLTFREGQALRLFLNNGAGIFIDVTDSNVPSMSGEAMALDMGDIDGDGDLDAVIAYKGAKDTLLINDGNGIYSKDANFNLPETVDASSDILFVDIEADGDIDVLTTNNDIIGASSIRNRLYLNENGSFTDVTQSLPIDNEATEAADCGDIDEDRDIDLIFGNRVQNAVFLNNSAGTFEDKTSTNIPSNYFATRDTRLGDVDGDGDLDMVAIGQDAVSLLVNDGQGRFSDDSLKIPDYVSIPSPIGGKSLDLTDVDGDGDLDIIMGGSPIRILINRLENKAPVLTSIGDKIVSVGRTLTFNVTALDPNGDNLIFLAENLPAGATFQSQVFNWTPSQSDVGEHRNIRFIVREDNQDTPLEDSEEIKITVTYNNPPTLSVEPSQNELTLNKGDSLVFSASATDPEGNLPITISWKVDGQSVGGTIDDFSLLSVIFGTGDHEIIVTATDSEGASSSFTWTLHVIDPASQNHAPVIDETYPATTEVPTIYVQPGGFATQGFAVTEYHDPDSDNVAFSWFKRTAGGTYEAIPQLAGQTSGFIGLTAGEYYIKVMLTDDGSPNLSTSFEWHVTIIETAEENHAPVIGQTNPATTEVPTIYVQPGGFATQSFAVTEYHDPDSDNVAFSWFKRTAGGTYEAIPQLAGQTSGFIGLTAGEYYIKVMLTDDGSPNLSTSFEWHVTIIETAEENHAPVIDAVTPVSSEIPPISIEPGNSTTQDFAVTEYHDPDSDNVAFSWFKKAAGGTYEVIAGAQGQTLTIDLTAGEYYIKVTLTDDGSPNLSTSFEWHVTITELPQETINDEIVETAFQYFWNETDNPSTGFVRDRLSVDPLNRNSSYDSKYEMASMAATGFGLAAMTVAAEKYGDGSDPDWQVTPEQLTARAQLIIDKLLEIQGNQNPQDELSLARWGRDGFFYHYVNINDGTRWGDSEVSTIDTAILVAGALTAGEYFGGDIKTKALQLYRNVNWRAFLDENATVLNSHIIANPYHNQIYHAWSPDRPAGDRYYGHWDYSDEGLLLYLLAVASPEAGHGILAENFYSFRRELGKYGDPSARPIVQTWFGPLFVYQYPVAFFKFRDASGGPLFDKQGVDWFENSVGAAKANKKYCNDNIAYFAGEEDLWGLSAGYTNGFNYRVYGAPPAAVPIPWQDVYGADGTVMPSAIAGSIALIPQDAQRALDKMKELRDVYNHPIWGSYGFVSSFKLGQSLSDTPFPIAEFYSGIDLGIMLIMEENHKTGLVWNKFSNFEIEAGVTLRDKIIEKIGFSQDATCRIAVDDVGPASNFHFGYLDQNRSTNLIQFELTAVANRPYLLAVHSYMDRDIGDHSVMVNVRVNSGDPFSVTFDYRTGGRPQDLIKYIEIDNNLLASGTNTITLEWQGATNDATWIAWRNIEISSPIAGGAWTIARDEVSNPPVLFGSEYRVDDTYYVGADIRSCEQAVNKDVENFTDIVFYTETIEYATLVLDILKTQEDLTTNMSIFVNDAPGPVLDTQVITGQEIQTAGFFLNYGWNRITIYHPGVASGANGEWVRWKRLTLQEATPPGITAPGGFVGASFGKYETRLRWNAVSGANAYNIYRSETQGGPYVNVASVTAPDAIYRDNNEGAGLAPSTNYYYIIRAQRGDGAESLNSQEIKVTTGPYQLDYGDGRSPNVFGGETYDNSGTALGNNAFVLTNRYNGQSGNVRKFTLASGQKNSIGLNGSNINDTTIFSFRVKSENSQDKFQIRLKDSLGNQSSVSLESPTPGIWQEIHLYVVDSFAEVNMANVETIEVISETTGRQMTLYFDEVEFSTVPFAGDRLDVKIRNGIGDGRTTAVDFGTATAENSTVLANQYLEIDYISSGTWGIQIYTDNKASDAYPKFTGSGDRANGLVGVGNSGYRVPMIWQVWQDKRGYYNGTETPEFDTTVDDGDQAEFAFVMDRSDPDWAIDQYVRNYRTLINNNGDLGAPVPLAPGGGYWPRVGNVSQPLFVYLAADFKGAPAQQYATNQLTLDIYHE